jgi:hypothetical protein
MCFDFYFEFKPIPTHRRFESQRPLPNTQPQPNNQAGKLNQNNNGNSTSRSKLGEVPGLNRRQSNKTNR